MTLTRKQRQKKNEANRRWYKLHGAEYYADYYARKSLKPKRRVKGQTKAK